MFDGHSTGWQAALELRFHRRGERTLCSHRHRGPLRLQKPLHPEGEAICHAIVIHPPGGIAGGDVLDIEAEIEAGAHALLTTPGATKWYKANGRTASQKVRLAVRGVLEWLPQEAIVFDAAAARSTIEIDLHDDATMIGWDIVALGRRAAAESFRHGRFAQSIRLRIDGRLIWHERTQLDGGDALLDSPVGLGGRHVLGCLWAAGPAVEATDLDDVRAELIASRAAVAVTRLAPRLFVARIASEGTAAARAALGTVWRALRPRLCGIAAQAPRLWAT
jgi:urease accessory protein